MPPQCHHNRHNKRWVGRLGKSITFPFPFHLEVPSAEKFSLHFELFHSLEDKLSQESPSNASPWTCASCAAPRGPHWRLPLRSGLERRIASRQPRPRLQLRNSDTATLGRFKIDSATQICPQPQGWWINVDSDHAETRIHRCCGITNALKLGLGPRQ